MELVLYNYVAESLLKNCYSKIVNENLLLYFSVILSKVLEALLLAVT